VPIEEFGKVLEWFGPLSNGDDFLDKLGSFFTKPVFHGNINQVEAEHRLNGEKIGSYLVRLSSVPGTFVVSHKSKKNKGKIAHIRIFHKPELDYLYGKDEYSTLEEAIEALKKDLSLSIECPGSTVYRDVVAKRVEEYILDKGVVAFVEALSKSIVQTIASTLGVKGKVEVGAEIKKQGLETFFKNFSQIDLESWCADLKIKLT